MIFNGERCGDNGVSPFVVWARGKPTSDVVSIRRRLPIRDFTSGKPERVTEQRRATGEISRYQPGYDPLAVRVRHILHFDGEAILARPSFLTRALSSNDASTVSMSRALVALKHAAARPGRSMDIGSSL